ncbi:MAG: L-aspartate oxidase [Actinomycetota bacterium]|nr:L-aspartate oxidase [Actinomycetota bacterium]
MITVPSGLLAPEPGWSARADVVIIGSGIAGLTTALRLAGAPTASGPLARVLVVTKDVLAAGSTRWAQGGIAAALGADDSPDDHLADTLTAGVGICDVAAVRVLVDEGPAAVRELLALGTRFDRTAGGELALTREGGHHRNRIAHAGGDATGAEIERALVARVLEEPTIEVIEHAIVLDLLRASDGGVTGLTLHVMGEGQRDGVGAVLAGAVVLATGGMGQVFASTTNPSVSTGDGVAAALRAGAVVRDLEFVQFHPTVLWLGHRAHGQQPLVSEAVRGEGAFLVDDAGVPFLRGQHELADLAPRDVVAKAIVRRMRETGAEHVWLDGRSFGPEKWRVRFPTILASLESHGIDPVRELIPVVPACHYASGGVRTDLRGRSSVARLYACGEAACTGVHGANRLASNSLLEGLVFGRRIAADIIDRRPAAAQTVAPVPTDVRTGLVDDAGREELQALMSAEVGVLRDAAGLARAEKGVEVLAGYATATADIGRWEATNLVTVAAALVAAARRREETRGSHWREDFADRDDAHWRGHLDTVLTSDGTLRTAYAPIPPETEPAVARPGDAGGSS